MTHPLWMIAAVHCVVLGNAHECTMTHTLWMIAAVHCVVVGNAHECTMTHPLWMIAAVHCVVVGNAHECTMTHPLWMIAAVHCVVLGSAHECTMTHPLWMIAMVHCKYPRVIYGFTGAQTGCTSITGPPWWLKWLFLTFPVLKQYLQLKCRVGACIEELLACLCASAHPTFTKHPGLSTLHFWIAVLDRVAKLKQQYVVLASNLSSGR